MNASRSSAGLGVGGGSIIRTGLQRLGLWFLFVVVVTLFTLLFSFLGTITCAVVAGMMTGVIGHRRRQAVLASLVFPALMIGLSQFSRADMAVRQRAVLAAVCFGAFWVPYGFTLLLVSSERAGGKTIADPIRVSARRSRNGDEPVVETCLRDAAGHEPVLARGAFGLEVLQGQWWSDTGGSDGRSPRRRMDIDGHDVALSILDGDGRVRCLARGILRIEERPDPRTMISAAPAPDVTAGLRDGI